MPLRQDSRGRLFYVGEDRPSGRTDIQLTGQFSIVKYVHDDGTEERYLVLMGQRPENRKLVFRLAPEGFTLGEGAAPLVDLAGGSRRG